MSVDYRKLSTDPLWVRFWTESDIVLGKRLELRRQLEGTSAVDPHTLGKIRGQLELLEQLPKLVEARADIERQKDEEKFIGGAPVRAEASRWPKWIPRIR